MCGRYRLFEITFDLLLFLEADWENVYRKSFLLQIEATTVPSDTSCMSGLFK